jgi:hypothetical protein
MKLLAVTLCLICVAARPAFGFNLERFQDSSNGKWYPVRWGPSTRTVRFRLNNRSLDLLPNLASNIMLQPAIEAAMQPWDVAPIDLQIERTTATASAAGDGVNLISFADTPANRDFSGSALGSTLRWWSRSGSGSQTYWRITEVDIVLHPKEKFATDGRSNAFDFSGIMTHEFGHALGLSHTPVASAAMWAYNYHGETRARTLDPDDVAAIRTTYGDVEDAGLGALTGRVLSTTETPILGAHVVATDTAGVLRGSAFTEKDGRFFMPLLPPGSYSVHAEPINPIFSTGEFSYDYYRAAQRGFQTTFFGGRQPQSIRVVPGEPTIIEPIRVQVQQPRLTIEYLASSPNGTDYSNFGARAMTMPAGSYTVLALTGRNLSRDTTISTSGTDITLYPDSYRADPTSEGYTHLFVSVSVRSGAAPGGRNLYVSRDGELAAFPGGIKVTSR